MIRRLMLVWLKWKLACLQNEQRQYVETGFPVGPLYLANCEEQEFDLRSRISVLQCGLWSIERGFR